MQASLDDEVIVQYFFLEAHSANFASIIMKYFIDQRTIYYLHCLQIKAFIYLIDTFHNSIKITDQRSNSVVRAHRALVSGHRGVIGAQPTLETP